MFRRRSGQHSACFFARPHYGDRTRACLPGVVWAMARHTLEDGLLLVFALPYYLLIGGAEIKFARYVVPILPVLLLFAARLLAGEEGKREGDGETEGRDEENRRPSGT